MSDSRDELHHLIDSLPEEQVEQVLADVRRRAKPRQVPSEKAFAWIGAGPANNDAQ
jgi:NADPH-dependent glutamate synthase beta subunit-like oxidoreductase